MPGKYWDCDGLGDVVSAVWNFCSWMVSINWVNLFGLGEICAWFWGDFWCEFWDGEMRDDREKLGFYDTVVDMMGEWWRVWVGRDLLGNVDFSVSVEIDLLMLQSRSWIFARIKSTPIPYFSWRLIDISGHENILSE